MKCIAIIPARGGSKRIPRKNILPFNGQPMISYAITIAQNSKLFDAVVVSTDDDEIATISKSFGAIVPFMRPRELSDDHTTTVPVIQHAVKQLQFKNPDIQYVCCIYPCVPFLKSEDLLEANKLLLQTNANFVYPILRFENNPYRAMKRNIDGSMSFLFPEHEKTRTQDLEPCFYDAGQFYFGKSEAWVKGMLMHSGGIGIEMDANRLIDIDTYSDWNQAELRAYTMNSKVEN